MAQATPLALVPAQRQGLPWPGLLLAAGGAIAFSGKAIIVKLAYRHGVDAATLIMYRMLFALPFFVLLSLWAGRGKRGLPLRDWLIVAGLGFSGYYAASMLDFMGLAYISAGLERLILYLGPTLVLLIGVLFFKRRVSRRQWLALALSYAGTVIVFGHELHLQGPHVALGAALVFGSALSYSVYLVASGEVVGRLGALRLTGLASTVACLLCIGQFLLLHPQDPLASAAVAPTVLWLSLINGTACTVAPVLMVMMAIERIGSGLSSQIGMIGPMSTIALGMLLLGSSLVLVGVWLLTRWR